MEPLLTINEAARRLSVTVSCIRKWILQGRISYVKLGRCVRISGEEIERLVELGTKPAQEIKTRG